MILSDKSDTPWKKKVQLKKQLLILKTTFVFGCLFTRLGVRNPMTTSLKYPQFYKPLILYHQPNFAGLALVWGKSDAWGTKFKDALTLRMAQMVKHLPTMRETWVQSLVWEDGEESDMTERLHSLKKLKRQIMPSHLLWNVLLLCSSMNGSLTTTDLNKDLIFVIFLFINIWWLLTKNNI